MALKEPESMDELVYFTNRTLKEGKIGNVKAWVYREKCKKCGKALMGKPKDEKGKVLIRAKEYVCPACGFKVENQEYEDQLTCDIKYTCPYCGNESETTIPFKRKNFQGVPALVFECSKCRQKIPITKKIKELK